MSETYQALTEGEKQALKLLLAGHDAKSMARQLGFFRPHHAISDQDVLAAPAGVRAVRFRTDFANKAGANEVVSLVREGGEWRIAGIYID